MDRKTYIKELEFLLQDIQEDDRKDALSFYENYFDEAGEENESHVIEELGEPSRVAAIIKDGLHGKFDEHIHVGNSGFSDDNYQQSYQVIDVDAKESQSKNQGGFHFKDKWNCLESRDRIILIVIGIFALVPFSFPFFGVLGLFGGMFGFGFSFFSLFLCLIFGFWIITFILHVIAFIFIVIGVIQLFTLPGAGLIYIGIGCILLAIGKVFARIAIWFFKDCIPGIIDAISTGFAKIFKRGQNHENNI